ncbi:hypothetical protein OBBRIDRAFT_886999 [Obba rivulosa]|uniref:Velvet domain-containing protein n=1 Tax=Obba rivulosa TaxID=1052685 RepID=A0A8E2AUR7_9APHY|nr:hypothetical protein OBBRIDRAFT_886999 [Obba rivulosa]
MALTSRIRRMGSPEIDSPVTFISGEFAGRTIRGELVEVQKADLGRKYARKDRRPLDPPPVVQLKLSEVFDHGTPSSHERELVSYDEVMSFGFLCHVDLFPVFDVDLSGYSPQEQERRRYDSVSGPITASDPHSYCPSSPDFSSASPQQQISAQLQARTAVPFSYTLPPPPPPSFHAFQSAGTPSNTSSSSSSGYVSTPAYQIASPTVLTTSIHSSVTLSSSKVHPGLSGAAPTCPIALPGVLPSLSLLIPGIPGMGLHNMVGVHDASQHVSDSPPDVVAFYDEFPVTEGSKCTNLLAGTTFQDSSVVDLHGKQSIVFVFSDLAVRQEGTFIVRYRVFNVFGQATGSRPIPVIAECFGGPFKIYSTKDFPGLRASTDLTKACWFRISLHGIRTNIRARERKRRKRTDSERMDASPSAPGSPAGLSQALTNGKVRRKHYRDEDEEYEEDSPTED